MSTVPMDAITVSLTANALSVKLASTLLADTALLISRQPITAPLLASPASTPLTVHHVEITTGSTTIQLTQPSAA